MEPRRGSGRRLLIVGAGPIGIEAALYALRLGYQVRVLEAGRVGRHVLAWGHVRMFSPWGMNCSSLGLEALRRGGLAPFEDGASCPTGREYVKRYLEPLARGPSLRDRILTGTRVVAIGRDGLTKGDAIGDPARGRMPFRLLAERKGRTAAHSADLLIDASGTYGKHRHLGNGGVPAPGEIEAASRIEYGIPDLLGERASVYAGRRTLLVGDGYSAATAAVALASLARHHPRTRALWAYRCEGSAPYVRFAADPLPSRDRLAVEANDIARGATAAIRTLPGAMVEAIEMEGGNADGRWRPAAALRVTLRADGRRVGVRCDRILAQVGYAPDRSIYEELQVHECYATGGPMRLAAALLAESGAAGDCLAGSTPTADLLSNPEPNFFILGSKSYGRNSTFLIRGGLDQVRTLFASLERRPTLDLYSEPRMERYATAITRRAGGGAPAHRGP